MFNSINKKREWMIIWTLVLGAMLFLLPQNASSASMREDYPRYRLKVGTNNVANLLSTWTKAITSYDSSKYDPAENKFTTDIFWDNAAKYRVKKQTKSLFGLEAVKGRIRSTFPNCDIKEKHLLWILFFTNWTWVYLKEEIIKTIPQGQWPTRDDQEKWCEALSKCMLGNPNFYNVTCDWFVRDAYFDGVNLKERLTTMEESNLWAEKYYNWTLDDSTYDIFYDIGQLGKIFYEDVAPVKDTSVIFYRMPQFNYWSNWGDWWSDGRGPAANQKNWWTATPKVNAWWAKVVTPWTNWWTQSPSSTTTQTPTPTRNGGNSIPSITEDDEINALLNNDPQEQATLTNEGNIAYINKCVVSWSPKLEEAYLAAEEAEEDDEEAPSPFELTEEYIDELTDDIIKNSNKLTIKAETPLTGENKKEQWDFPGKLWASTSTAVIDELRKQLQGCLDKCDSLRFDERAVCKVKCLCWEYSSKALPEKTKLKFLEEWALRIRICNIPSKAVVVSTSTKSVISVETIIAEIHDTLKALFESWELTPKMKKQEWLDTSMNNIKFSDVVSFNIWMQFKKPTVERPVKKEDLADVKKELEKDILNITQNGFNVVGDVELVNHSATTMSKTLEVPSLTQTSENTSTLIELNRLSWVNGTFYKFIEDHKQLINNLKAIVEEMTKTIEWRLS